MQGSDSEPESDGIDRQDTPSDATKKSQMLKQRFECVQQDFSLAKNRNAVKMGLNAKPRSKEAVRGGIRIDGVSRRRGSYHSIMQRLSQKSLLDNDSD